MSSIYRKYFSPPKKENLAKSRYGKKQLETSEEYKAGNVYRSNVEQVVNSY